MSKYQALVRAGYTFAVDDRLWLQGIIRAARAVFGSSSDAEILRDGNANDVASRVRIRVDTIEVSAQGGGERLIIRMRVPSRRLSPRTRWALQRVAANLAVACSLRAAPSATDEVPGDDGAVALDEATSIWNGLLAGRWSLVRAIEVSGRRELLLHRQGPMSRGGHDPTARRAAAVIALVARGHSNKAIAYELGLSISTVAADLRRVLGRLGLTRRADLIRLVGVPSPVG